MFFSRRWTPHFLIYSLITLWQPLSTLANYDPSACNNSPHLCSLSYGDITYLGTHNSPFLRNKQTGFSTSGNQYFNVTVQLDAGIRLLQGQLHQDPDGSEPRMCHSSCSLLDGGSLTEWLSQIQTWMQSHPSEVVTLLIVNSDNIAAKTLETYFSNSKTADMAYVPPQGTKIRSFPTLQTMIKDNKRLVIFLTSSFDYTSAPYLLNEWDFIWETQWQTTDPQGWSCDLDRPAALRNSTQMAEQQGIVPPLNWFLYQNMGLGILQPNVDIIYTTNGDGLTSGLKNCAASSAWEYLPVPRVPIFILVDFFNEGNPISTVDTLNNVTNPINRVAPPPTPSQTPSQGDVGGKSAGELSLDNLLMQIDSGKNPTWGDWIIAGGNWGPQISINL